MNYFNQLLDSYNLLKKRKLKIRLVSEQEDKESKRGNLQAGANLLQAAVRTAKAQQKPLEGVGNRQNITVTPNQDLSVNIKGSNLGANGITLQDGEELTIFNGQWDHPNAVHKKGPRLAAAFFGGAGENGEAGGAEDEEAARTEQPPDPEEAMAMQELGALQKELANEIHQYGLDGQAALEGAPEDRDSLATAAQRGEYIAHGIGTQPGDPAYRLGSKQADKEDVAQKLIADIANSTNATTEEKIAAVKDILKSFRVINRINSGSTVPDNELQGAMLNKVLTPFGLDVNGLYFQYMNKATPEKDIFFGVAQSLNKEVESRLEDGERPATMKLDTIPVIESVDSGRTFANRGPVAEHVRKAAVAAVTWRRELKKCESSPATCDKSLIAKQRKKLGDYFEEAKKSGTLKEIQDMFTLGMDTRLMGILSRRDQVGVAAYLDELKNYFVKYMNFTGPQVEEMFRLSADREGIGLAVLGAASRQMVEAAYGDCMPSDVTDVGQNQADAKSAQEGGAKADNEDTFDCGEWKQTLETQTKDHQWITQGVSKKLGSLGVGLGSLTDKMGSESKTLGKNRDGGAGDSTIHKWLNGFKGNFKFSKNEKEWNELNSRRTALIGVDKSASDRATQQWEDRTSTMQAIFSRGKIKDVPKAKQSILNAYKQGRMRQVNPGSIEGIKTNDRLQSALRYVNGSKDGKDLENFKKVGFEIAQFQLAALLNDGKAGSITGDQSHMLSDILSRQSGSTEETRRLKQVLHNNTQGVYVNNEMLYGVLAKVSSGEFQWSRRDDYGATVKITDKEGNWYYSISFNRGNMIAKINKKMYANISPSQTENSSNILGTGDLMIEFLRGQQKLIDQLLV